MKKLDLTGQKFSRLTVTRFLYYKHGMRYWECKCECGGTTITNTNKLTSGHTKSCGCYARERAREANITHNQSYGRIYNTYAHIKQRCYNKKDKGYKNYGGRGISVCDEWLGKQGFTNFYNWAMENGYQDNLTIERVDVNGNYEPNNCTWITVEDQSLNRTTTKFIKYNGETKQLSLWCKALDLEYCIVYSRLYKGWNIEDAFFKEKKYTRKKQV